MRRIRNDCSDYLLLTAHCCIVKPRARVRAHVTDNGGMEGRESESLKFWISVWHHPIKSETCCKGATFVCTHINKLMLINRESISREADMIRSVERPPQWGNLGPKQSSGSENHLMFRPKLIHYPLQKSVKPWVFIVSSSAEVLISFPPELLLPSSLWVWANRLMLPNIPPSPDKPALNITAKCGCIHLIRTLSTLAASQRSASHPPPPPQEGEMRNFGGHIMSLHASLGCL